MINILGEDDVRGVNVRPIPAFWQIVFVLCVFVFSLSDVSCVFLFVGLCRVFFSSLILSPCRRTILSLKNEVCVPERLSRERL